MRILFFEPEIAGHHAAFVSHLVRYIVRHRPDLRAIFAIDPNLFERLDPEPQALWGEGRDGVVAAFPLSGVDIQTSFQPGLARRGLARWSVAARLAREMDVDHCCFLHIDYVMFPLMFGRRMSRRISVSGILMRPTTHYPEVFGARKEPREMIRFAMKSMLYRGALANPSLTTLFSLDPYFPDYAERRHQARGRVHTLPDPSLFSPATTPCATPSLPEFTANRVLFLIFGSLTIGKGIETVLQAARLLDRRIQRACAIVFAGQIDPMIRDRFLMAYREIGGACPDLALHLEDRYLQEPELAGLVRRADVVLAPYHRNTGSSGVLYWAAGARKPIITENYGLIGRQTRDFGLGVAIDTRDPAVLAIAMARVVEAGPPSICRPEGQKAFCEGHSPDDFAQAMVEGIAGETGQE